MWTTCRVERTGGHTNFMVNRNRLQKVISGYCRIQSKSLTHDIPRDIVNICYIYSKQLWTHIGGKYFELFDLVYFGMLLPEKMVRTYLHQIIEELERNPNIAVIEPSDLLLDETFTLFIVHQNNKTKVETYTAPELLSPQLPSKPIAKYSQYQPLTRHKSNPKYLESEQWTHRRAIFSLGVILFILLLGHIPFEKAVASDPWYKMLINCEYDKYWKTFKSSKINKHAKKMLQRMLSPTERRMDIHQIKQCDFYIGEIYNKSEDIIAYFKYKYNVKEEKRRQMIAYNHATMYKITEDLNINKIFDIDTNSDLFFPADEIEGIFDTYCSNIEYDKIYYCLAQVIEEKYFGSVQFDADKQSLICAVKTDRDIVTFGVKVYKSRRWWLAHQDKDFEFDVEDYKALYVVRFYRMEGDSFEFSKIKNLRLLLCADVMSGLTKEQRRAFRNLYSSMIERKQTEDMNNNFNFINMPEQYGNTEEMRYFWY